MVSNVLMGHGRCRNANGSNGSGVGVVVEMTIGAVDVPMVVVVVGCGWCLMVWWRMPLLVVAISMVKMVGMATKMTFTQWYIDDCRGVVSTAVTVATVAMLIVIKRQ